jgi:two-component sensor histidine kinase
MRGVVERYGQGETSARFGQQRNQEMAELGAAFDRMADDIGTHEDEQAVALATQKKLTREVHHRVKNNLQIVSSLISLQSRDAATPEVAYAYATIQKRVNALALVHRWLFDDEALRGVDLKSLTQDLCAGLEQSVGNSENTSVSIQPQVDRVYVGQDTAVPLAFLMTELVTAAARQATGPSVRVEVAAKRDGAQAVLSVASESFVDGADFTASATPEARIAIGMARQMRSAIRFDPAAGRYSIAFPAA